MPNWIEGTLKVRGKKDNLINFLENGISKNSFQEGTDEKMVTFDFDGDYCEVEIASEAYISDTKRAFVNEHCWVNFDNDIDTICIPIKQAWGFVREDWTNISNKYDVDVRLYGFEGGGQFCQEIEIIKGLVTLSSTIQYTDWKWDCPMPTLGG